MAEATVGTVVDEVAERLAGGGGATAKAGATREARELVAALLEVPRFWPVANPEQRVEGELRKRAHKAAMLRARGAPPQYAVGTAAFRHLTLAVDDRVLIPRPETELLVDLVLKALADCQGGVVIDVGTGSGAIAIALATEGRFDRVYATDVSAAALEVATANAARAGVSSSTIQFAHGHLLEPVRSIRARAVVSNPPYIADDEAASLPPSVRDWEPALALFSGADGLAATRDLVRTAADVLEPNGLLALEVDERRAVQVLNLVDNDARYTGAAIVLDLTGRERFVLARRRENS